MTDAALTPAFAERDVMRNLSNNGDPRNTELIAVKQLQDEAQRYATAYQGGQLTLQEAVDRSQQFAEGRGLIDVLGQDRVQAIIAHAFAGRERA